MAKRRTVCLFLIILFSLGGIYTSVHLMEIHYKKPRYLLNLLNTVPLLDRFYDRAAIEESARKEKMKSEGFQIDPFDDPAFDPYESAMNAYKNIMTEEEAASGNFGEEACDISETLSCSKVDDSEYSEIGGIAISLYGTAGYSILIILSVICLFTQRTRAIAHSSGKKPDLFALLLYLGCWGGIIFSVWLTCIEAFVLETYCPYCVASAILTALAFIAVLAGFGVEPVTIFFKKNVSKTAEDV